MRGLVLFAVACSGASKGAVDPSLTSNAVKLEWRAVQGSGQNVDVTLVAAGAELALGSLNAAADNGPSTCTLRKAEATVTEFLCGSTSAYNYFVAELKSGQLIVSRVTGVVADPNSDERKVIQRIDVSGTSLAVAPFAAQ